MFARRIFIDIWLTAFLSLTLVFFALSERYPERRRPLPGADVRLGRARRADEGAGRDRAARRWPSRSTSACAASCGRVTR